MGHPRTAKRVSFKTRSRVRSKHTFRKQAALIVFGIPTKKPAIAKVIVTLDQLDAVAPS